jgi:hypothetical protein
MTHFDRYEHSMTRVDIVTGVGFDEFVSALDAAAPPFDAVAVQRIVETGGSWDDVRAAAADNAPYELMVYAKIDATPLFSRAGHDVKAIEYLLGNHVIAETMFRHDPKALLYAPLRVRSLDRKVANLLRVIGVDPGNAFN